MCVQRVKAFISLTIIFAYVFVAIPSSFAGQSAIVTNFMDGQDLKSTIPGLDINSVQVQLSSDRATRIAISTKGNIDIGSLNNKTSLFGIDFEVAAGGQILKYGVNTFESKVSSDFTESVPFYDSQVKQVPNCEADVRLEDLNQIVFNIPFACVGKSDSYRLKVASIDRRQGDGEKAILDSAPEAGNWITVNTNYIDFFPCNSVKKNSIVNYGDIQYICTLKSGKWKFVDYAPIAVAKAKYLTEKAYYACHLSAGQSGVALSDKGKTLVLNNGGDRSVTSTRYICVALVMGLPSSISSQIAMTRAIDGIQRAKWKQISLVWNYHPDNGLGITFSYN